MYEFILKDKYNLSDQEWTFADKEFYLVPPET